MPVQNSNSKISVCPDSYSYLVLILIPNTFNSILCQKGQFTLQVCPRQCYFSKIFGYFPQKVKIDNFFIEFFACPKRRFSGNCQPKER